MSRLKRVFVLDRGLVAVSAGFWLFGLGSSMVGVFIPLLLLDAGAAFWQVAAYFTMTALFRLVLNFPVVFLMKRKGIRVTLSIGFAAAALQFVSLAFFAESLSWWWISGAAFLLAAANALIWRSRHVYISRVMDQFVVGRSLATIDAVGQALGIVGPIAGGVIGAVFGARALLIIGSVITVCAVFAVRNLVDVDGEIALSPTDSPQPSALGLRGAPARDAVANFCYNVEASVGFAAWPVFLALEVKDYGGIGIVATVGAVSAALVGLLSGHRGDRGKSTSVLIEGAVAKSIIHVCRIFIRGTAGIALIAGGYQSAAAYFVNSWTATYYAHAKRKGLAYVFTMELFADGAQVALWGTLLVVAKTSSVGSFYVAAFVIAAVASLGCLVITPSRHSAAEQVDAVPA